MTKSKTAGAPILMPVASPTVDPTTADSQLLTSGVVPIEWLASQMGHCSTQMIHQHYGRLINTDAPDHVSRLNEQLGLG